MSAPETRFHRPAPVNLVAAVQVMDDGCRADHRVPREVELFEKVEDVRLPMILRSRWFEEDGLELAHLARDLGHLGGAEVARVGKDGQAVAPVGRRGEHVNELELHRSDATRVAAVSWRSSSPSTIACPDTARPAPTHRWWRRFAGFFKRVIPSGTLRAIRKLQRAMASSTVRQNGGGALRSAT